MERDLNWTPTRYTTYLPSGDKPTNSTVLTLFWSFYAKSNFFSNQKYRTFAEKKSSLEIRYHLNKFQYFRKSSSVGEDLH